MYSIRDALGTPSNLNTKTISELDAICEETENVTVFDEGSISKLGITNIAIPIETKNTFLSYKLYEDNRVVGFPSSYNLDIIVTKGLASATLSAKMISTDDAQISNCEIEMSRIESMMIDGKIKTNKDGANLLFPSKEVIDIGKKPFNDDGIVTPGVVTEYHKVNHNDAEGEVTIIMMFHSMGEKSVSIEVILFGYLTLQEALANNQLQVIGAPNPSSTKSAKFLKELSEQNGLSPRIFNETAMIELGITGMQPSKILGNHTLRYVLHSFLWEPGKNAIFRLTITLLREEKSYVKDYYINSSDEVKMDESTTEKERIQFKLQNGKIPTNIANANSFKPSEVAINENSKPFDDLLNNPNGISYRFRKLSSDDSIGEVTIDIEITSNNDSSSSSLIVILTGFFYINSTDITDCEDIKTIVKEVNVEANRSYEKLLDFKTDVEVSFDSQKITALGLTNNLPSDMKGVNVTYTLHSIKEIPYEICEYNLVIHYRKGNYHTYSEHTIASNYPVTSDTTFELLRLKKLIGTFINTNIANASSMLPSEVSIGEHTKPFHDDGVQTSGVSIRFQTLWKDDGRGLIGINASISSANSYTLNYPFTLRGFISNLDIINKYKDDVINHFAYTNVVSMEHKNNLHTLEQMGWVTYEDLEIKTGVVGNLVTLPSNCALRFKLTNRQEGSQTGAWYDVTAQLKSGEAIFQFMFKLRTNSEVS